MEHSNPRPLLPSPALCGQGSRPPGPPGPPGRPRELPPKRRSTTAACESCRLIRRKCDGRRPTCGSCSARNTECVYTGEPSETRNTALKRKYGELEQEADRLRSSNTVLTELVNIIRSRDERDASTIFQRLRGGADPESIVRAVHDGDLLLQLQVVPETRFRFVFPFRKEMPTFLRVFAEPYLSSVLFEATAEATGEENRALPALPTEDQRPEFSMPYHAAKIVDPRLDAITPSKWTTVSGDDKLMRSLIRLYYQYEYHFFSCFHMDAFLDDMVSGSDRFCSSLLVNAVLAQACDRLEHWNPQSLGYRFFAEAKRQFEEQLNVSNSVTLLQASMVINIILNMHSMDKLGMTYTAHATAIAYNLGLFEAPSRTRSRIRQRVYDYTAWNLYCLQCYHFLLVPLITDPPKNPLPDPKEDREWYGETWVHYPANQAAIPLNHGYTCKAKAELAQIVNLIAKRLFAVEEGSKGPSPPLVGMVKDYSAKLQHWFTNLPPCLTAREIVLPFQLKLHLCYHNLIVNLCELPVLDGDDPSLSKEKDDINEMLVHSRACFEAIIRLYYLRHGYEYSDTYMTHDLTVLAFMALARAGTTLSTETDVEETRSTLILAAKGLNEQGRNYYMPFTLFHILLEQMSARDLDVLYTLTNIRKESVGVSKERAKHVQAQYPVNVVNMISHPEKERISDLIKHYAGLAIEAQSPGGSETN